MENLTWQEAKRYMEELPFHTKKNPFSKVKAFYEWLGAPGDSFPIIHVAGTNGKGSVCAFCNSILSEAGFCVGLFTSPHLTDIRERFVFQNAMLEKEEFARLLSLLFQKLESYRDGSFRPAYFETLFFLFMLWMEEKRPDVIVLETGLGGKTDATNVISHPAICVVTKIGKDHCSLLGESIEEIAGQKAGIFKEKVPAVCWDTDPAVKEVFVRRAEELSVSLTFVSSKEVAFSKLTKNSVDFFLESAYYKDVKAMLQTPALYQADNAALAVYAIEQSGLRERVSKQALVSGLCRMRISARMEEVRPGVFVDGANNPDGIRAFLESVAKDGCAGRRWLLFGAASDKDSEGMVRQIKASRLFDVVAGSVAHNDRSLSEWQLRKLLGADADIFLDAGAALCTWLEKKGQVDRIYVTGSLYLAGEIIQFWGQEVSHDQF